MTVTDTKDFFDEIFDSASAAYSVDMEYLKVVNSVRSAIRKFSDVELIVFPGLPESRIFAKRLWRAAYVVWAFEYCEHTRPPMAASELISGNLTRQQLEKETLGDRVISADAHYFAQTVVSIAYAERTVSDMKRRWQERLVQRVKSYLVFHLAKALYQYSVVTELFKTEQESLHDIVVRYYEMILPDPDFDSLRRRDMSNVYADATHHWDVYDGAQAWKKRREKLKEEQESLLSYDSSSDMARKRLDAMLGDRLEFLRGLLEKVNRNDIVFDPAEKRILPMGTYLTPDQKGTECDRFASVRRRLKELDDCCLRDRIEVHGENLMLRDKRKPVLEIRFMSVSKDGTRRGRRKVESVRFMNPKMIEDMLLLLEAYRNGDEWVQMPKDWTKRFQNRKGKETSPARRFKDRFVEMQRLRDGYWTGLARISDSGFKSLR